MRSTPKSAASSASAAGSSALAAPGGAGKQDGVIRLTGTTAARQQSMVAVARSPNAERMLLLMVKAEPR